MTLDEAKGATDAVRVRTRRTLASNGRMTTASSVDCPRRAREVPLQTCLRCDRFQKLGTTEDGRHADVHCHALDRAQRAALDPRSPRRRGDAVCAQAQRVPISAIMTTDVICVREDVSLDAVTALLLEFGISGVPVVDASGVPVGIVSKTDLVGERYEHAGTGSLGPDWERDPTGLSWALGAGVPEESALSPTAGDMMIRVFTLPESATVAEAAALMHRECVHRVPVTCAEGKVVGIVSAMDIVRWLAEQAGDGARL